MDRKEGIFLRQSVNQIVFAAVLLFVGIFLLLVNVGVISLEIKELIVESYPFFVLFLSVLMIFKSLLKHKMASLFWGIFFLAFSIMLCLDRLKFISFQFNDFWKLWPVLFIYYGLYLLVKKDKVKVIFDTDLSKHYIKTENHEQNTENLYSGQSNSEKRIRGFSVGDVEFKKSNWSLEPMKLSNTIGDYFIDFSKAYIPEKETPVVVQGWIGDVKMLVPDDVAVQVQAKVKIGDIRIFDLRSSDINRQLVYKTPGYEDYLRKLTITIELKIGSIRIDKV